MSFLSDIVNFGKTAVGLVSGTGIFSTLARTAILGYAVNRLSKSANKGQDSGTNNIDEGVRLQVKPNADSKIPVLYGSAFFGGNIIDAAMTNNNKTMWFALALTEKTGSLYSTSSATTYLLNNVYLNDQRVQFQGDGITVDYTLDRGGNIDRNASGLIQIYFYAGGRTAGQLPVGFAGAVANSEAVFPNWTSGTHALTNVVFALVKVDYNRDKGITGLPDVKFNIASSMFTPGDVIYDYLTNTTYGAGISAGDILTTDITALNTYSLASVAYADQGTGAQTLGDRYQINGLIDTANSVLDNSEAILNATASWLSYDTHEGKWGVIINKAETSVAAFDDTNIIGNISVSGTGLQDLYNAVKVQFPHRELRDSADFYNISVPTSAVPADWSPFSLNSNEEPKTLNITYDIVNEPIQAQMLGLIELKQSRIDKVIQFKTDWTYYNLKAGDVIDVTNSRFGFSAKLFRIIAVKEQQDNDGALMMDITALEYNVNVYSVVDLFRFTRSDANGIITFGSIGTPGTPTVSKVEIDSRPRVQISTTAPTGIVEAIEFWLSNDVSLADANRSYRVISVERPVGGGVYTSGTAVTFEYDSVSSSDFVVKTRGINTATTGPFSAVSGLVNFVPRQTTQAIDPSTSLFNSAGGLLGALSLVSLLTKVSDLFGSGDTGKSLFTRLFETFQSTTGLDILGQASSGSLVVASSLTVKADAVNLTTGATSIDFKTPLLATGGPAVEVKIKPGAKNKDILAYNKGTAQWETISDCIECDFVNIPPANGPTTPCKLLVAATLPANNFAGSDSTVCPPSSVVPFKGSYFIKFSIQAGRLGAVAAGTSSITTTTAFKYTIAQAGNTDFSWYGAPNNTVGTQWFATSPATNFPNGKTSLEITVGKRYKIRAVGSGFATTSKAYWESLGWEGVATPAVPAVAASAPGVTPVVVAVAAVAAVPASAAVPAVGDAFTATAVGTISSATVDKATDDTGFVYGLGEIDPDDSKSIVVPISKGTGNFVLYTTDGVVYDTVPIANCTVTSDVVEIPFKQRAPGTDYYVLWTAGIVTNCTCENDAAIDSAERWTFTTSEVPQTPYAPGQLSPSNLQTDASDVLERNKIDYTLSPTGALCGNGQSLKMTFTGTAPVGSPQVIVGSGSITFTEQSTNTVAASLSVSAATLTTTTVSNVTTTVVNFGAIPTLTPGSQYIINVPQGLLTTDGTALSSTFCGKTTTTPRVARPSLAKTRSVIAQEELRITLVEFCPAAQGKSTKRTNIKITFNKPIKVKASSPAEVSIFGGVFGSLFQKIDLRGTFTSKKYGDIYEGADSASDNPDTANNETSDDRTILVNPSQMMSGATNYYMNIPAGVIIDANCDLAWPGISDTTTIAWTTEGARMTPPSGSVPLTYGSVKFRWKVDRKTVPGNAFVNIVSAAGVFLTKVSAKDPAVKFKHNVPFDFVQTFSGAQVIRFGAAITAFTSSLTAIVDNAIGGQLGSNIVFTVSAVGRRIRFSQSSLSGSVVVNASVIRNVGTMTPTALITTSTLRI